MTPRERVRRALAFYGGVDVQQLLSFDTVEEVRQTGGYIVANSHHGVATIKGDNVVAMCEEARQCTGPENMA